LNSLSSFFFLALQICASSVISIKKILAIFFLNFGFRSFPGNALHVSCVLDLSFLLSKIFCTWQSESCLKSFALQSSLIFLFFDILEQFPFERSASPLGRDFVFNSLFFSFSFSAFVSCYLCLETWFSASFLPSIVVSSHSSFFFFLYLFVEVLSSIYLT